MSGLLVTVVVPLAAIRVCGVWIARRPDGRHVVAFTLRSLLERI